MRKLFGVTMMLVAVVTVGCGDTGGLTPTNGVVTLDGAPLEGATLLFVPTGAEGTNGTGATGPDGKFEMSTPQGKKGLPPGSYKVVISKKNIPAGYDPEKDGALDDSALKELVPLPYSDPEKTTLTATVEPGKTLDFTLTGGKKK